MTTLKKRFADKAGNIRVTPEDLKKAETIGTGSPRTAPGQQMHLEGALESQNQEIEALKAQLARASSTEIALHLIDEVEGRRRKLSPEKYAELTANLAQNPLMQPILLIAKPDGRYELVAGHNRKAIYHDLGREKIKADIVEIEPKDVGKLAFYTNLLAPSLPDFEKYLNFKLLQTETGLTQTELAQSAGISKQHLSRIMSYDALPEEAKALLANDPEKLGSNAAQKLSSLAETGRAKEVAEVIGKLVVGELNQEQAVALARPKPPQATPVQPLIVKNGRKHYCDIVVRKNVVGVTLKDCSAEEANSWATKIQAFIEAEVKKSS